MFNGGMGNMQGMMKKVQKLQADMAKMQEELKLRTIETTVGGGAVTVVVSGKKEVVSVKIDPSAVDPEDVEMLEDLLVAAVNEGMRKIDERTEAEMGKMTGGMPGVSYYRYAGRRGAPSGRNTAGGQAADPFV